MVIGEYFEPFYLELEFTGKEIEVCEPISVHWFHAYTHTLYYVCMYVQCRHTVYCLCVSSVSLAHTTSISTTLRADSSIQLWRDSGALCVCVCVCVY